MAGNSGGSVAANVVSLMRESHNLTEGLKELKSIVAEAVGRLGKVEERVEGVKVTLTEIQQLFRGNGGEKNLRTEVALLRRDVEELRERQDEQDARRWQMLMWAIGSSGGIGIVIALLSKVL